MEAPTARYITPNIRNNAYIVSCDAGERAESGERVRVKGSQKRGRGTAVPAPVGYLGEWGVVVNSV